MKNIKVLLIIIIISSLALSGCIGGKPSGTPTATPTVTPTPTVIPTTAAPTETVTPTATPEKAPIRYQVLVDSSYGFYRARAFRDNTSIQLPPSFNVLNFTISIGDRVKWINDDSYDQSLTIVSKDGLWTNANRTGYLYRSGDSFEYQFNKTGTYTFSIQEYPRLSQQKITVAP